MVERKECALQSFKAEVNNLNEKLKTLSVNYAKEKQYKDTSLTSDNADASKKLSIMKVDLENEKKQSEKLLRDHEESEKQIAAMKIKQASTEHELATLKERETLYDVARSNHQVNKAAEKWLHQLQDTWRKLGTPIREREHFRMNLKTCLEDTCARKFDENLKMIERIKIDIYNLQQSISDKFMALGYSERESELSETNFFGIPMLEHLDALKQKEQEILPSFNAACERRDNIVMEVESIRKALGPLGDKVSNDLEMLLKSKDFKRKKSIYTNERPIGKVNREKRAKILKNVEEKMKALEPIVDNAEEGKDTESNSDYDLNEDSLASQKYQVKFSFLSASFLEKCELDIKHLRLIKSEISAQNGERRNNTHELVEKMHLSTKELLSLFIHSVKKTMKNLPEWWDFITAEKVCLSVTKSHSITGIDDSFTKHLKLLYECLQKIADGRSIFAKNLKLVVEGAHKKLLDTVEDEFESSEAYAIFHDALFRLPPISKECMHSCIDEIKILVSAAEVMSRSEIEALTVVWEALTISPSERGRFWSEVDELTTNIETKTESPFDIVLQSSSTILEEWLLSSVKEATKSQRSLDVQLSRMEKIHNEVQKQRAKQDIKCNIMSLDSEMRIISAQVADFEQKASSKQRLLTKKMKSSKLLKEERFRKQMQSKFILKLEKMGELLQEWEKKEGSCFDPNILSDEVRTLLAKSDKFHSWVEERTAFMHLSTLKSNKRRLDDDSIQYLPDTPRSGPEEKQQSSPQSRGKSSYYTSKTPPRHPKTTTRHDVNLVSKLNRSRSSYTNGLQKRKLNPSSMIGNSKNQGGSPISRHNNLSAPTKSIQRVKAQSHKSSISASRESSICLPFGNLLETSPTKAKENIFPSES